MKRAIAIPAFTLIIFFLPGPKLALAKNPSLPLMPASNMKIVTTAAALEYLGRDFSFVTRVELCGGKSNAGDHNARWA